MAVRIPDEYLALIKMHGLRGWETERPRPGERFGPHIERFKAQQLELDPDEEVDRGMLVSMLALSLGRASALQPWVLENSQAGYPTDNPGWFELHKAAAWLIFQTHERELRALGEVLQGGGDG